MSKASCLHGKSDNSALMKSAYELAMERLSREDPEASRPLSDAQKQRIAEIDRVYKGRLAEREIFLKQRIEEALSAGNYAELPALKRQLADEKSRIEEECEDEKERVRRARN